MPGKGIFSLALIRKVGYFYLQGQIMTIWRCILCGYIYDETVGEPGDGIPAGTRWQDVPDTWKCPDCGIPKADFVMEEIPAQ